MPSYRILVVTNLWPTPDDPSFGSFVKAQMESLRPLGVDYDVLFVNGRASTWNYLRGIFLVRRELRAKPYDLIHAHFGLSGWVARFQARVPLVISFMGDDVLGRPKRDGKNTIGGKFLKFSGFLIARLASKVIVKSPEMSKALNGPVAVVIPNGVNLNLFKPIGQAEARRALGLDLNKKLVLFPYNPHEVRKRFDLIQEAVALAAQQVQNLELVNVRGLPQESIALYMNAADMLVMASMSEGSPNAVKEAMAVNLPVISVDVGDTRELIGSTEGCHLVPRDVKAIAERIVEVCRRGGRTNGREAIRRLSMESVAQQVVNVYAATLGR